MRPCDHSCTVCDCQLADVEHERDAAREDLRVTKATLGTAMAGVALMMRERDEARDLYVETEKRRSQALTELGDAIERAEKAEAEIEVLRRKVESPAHNCAMLEVELRERAEKAEAAAAEMRQRAERFASATSEMRQFIRSIWAKLMAALSSEEADAARHALSFDVGAGWHSPEEWAKLIAENEQLQARVAKTEELLRAWNATYKRSESKAAYDTDSYFDTSSALPLLDEVRALREQVANWKL